MYTPVITLKEALMHYKLWMRKMRKMRKKSSETEIGRERGRIRGKDTKRDINMKLIESRESHSSGKTSPPPQHIISYHVIYVLCLHLS